MSNSAVCYIYLIHEVPIEEPYFCKVGISAEPLARLRALQQGNPRPLRSWHYSRKPNRDFGWVLPSEELARELEIAIQEELEEEGVLLRQDYNYEKDSASLREWVMGLHPDVLADRIWHSWIGFLDQKGIEKTPSKWNTPNESEQ